ncbi:hypothetical protein LWI28_027339 [Acer negundo]|uniref:C2H2-type domain-containing protein n=1 Tax=Acer negundo TaxID=4023 RepID=A0AAD5IW70_ACENE|nr:hypothetical protein LWI28_027339 [Acer negundo]KAK4845785.1 hypothetical protein QYF36_009071 [Acer negundo]
MPKFKGAFYVYQHLVSACLSVHTKLVIDKFKDCKDLHSSKNKIQAEVQENGFQACKEEKLVSTEASLIENDKNKLAAEEIKEISEKVEEAGGELSEIQVSNQVKEEWTCSLCQVTTRREITYISHIQGRQHKAACYELEGLRKIYSVVVRNMLLLRKLL